MASQANAILNDLVTVLRGCGAFALVELGGSRAEATIPRAIVILERQETTVPDDDPSVKWIRLQARIVIRTRSESSSQAAGRIADLTDAAITAILTDQYRGGRCHDLPIGRATEVTQAEMSRDERYPQRKTSLTVSSPEIEIILIVRCHYQPADGSYSSGTLDGEALFSSGPCEVTPGSWQRDIVRRGFVGLDGELALDLGKRSRTIEQTGKLQAASVSSLQVLIDAINVKADGQLYTLVTGVGQTYTNVILENLRMKTPIRKGRGYWCDYSITYRQLP